MSEVIVCDRCGRKITWAESRRVTIRWFSIFISESDLCRSCNREFVKLYDDWWREGRGKR